MVEEERSSTFLRSDRKRKEKEIGDLWSILRLLRSADENQATDIFMRLRQTDDVLQFGAELDAAEVLPGTSREYAFSKSSEVSLRSDRTQPEEADESDHEHENDPSIEGEFSSLKFGSTGKLAQAYTAYTSPGISDEPKEVDILWSAEDWDDLRRDWHHIDELIAIYFKWQHSLFECFPEKYLRQDLQARHGEYYSPLLVHAICATATLMSDQTNAHGECLQHLHQALRLLRETPKASLATIAAASLLCHVEESRGRLSSMWMICGQMMRMALDMQLHLRQRTVPTHHDRHQMSSAQGFWSAFITDSIVSLTLSRLPSIPVAAITVALPQVDDDVVSHEWNANESPEHGGAGMQRSTFRRLVMLAKLVNSTLQLFYAPSRRISAKAIVDEHSRYLDWYVGMPAGLSDLADAPPNLIWLHMQYHSAVLLLFRPFLSARFPKFPATDPRQIVKDAAQRISQAFQEHLRQYQDSGICTFQVHCLLTACTIHILHLKDNRSLHHLITACNSFWILAPRILWAAASLHIIHGLVRKWHIQIPDSVADALYAPNGRLPNFDFAATSDANSYFTDISVTSPHDLAFEGNFNYAADTNQGMKDYVFTPFPNQQPPLLGPVLHDMEPVSSDMSGSFGSSEHTLTGMEWLGEDWLPSIGTWGSMEPNLS
jgi:hypothetical protein